MRGRGALVLLCALGLAGWAVQSHASSITGTVVDDRGSPRAGVRITLSGAKPAETLTDRAGAFAFGDLDPGRYTLAVQAPSGYVLPAPSLSVTAEAQMPASARFALLSLPPTLIPEIQGRGHLSPRNRENVSGVPGVVTAIRGSLGFYLQNPRPDGDAGTSEGILVTAAKQGSVRPGDLVLVAGRVQEYYGGGRDAGDLSVTQLRASEVRVLLRDLPIPAPVILGEGGLIPPDRVVCDDAAGNAEDSPFDPENDGLDFYESLEGMLVEVRDAIVVGSVHTSYGELYVVGDGGRHASSMSRRGALVLAEGDLNPERICVDVRGDPDIVSQPIPPAVVGDRFAGPIVGPLDYSYSDYKILPLERLPSLLPADLPREEAPDLRDSRTLTVATLNVENLSAQSDPRKIADIARTVTRALGCPDILALQEIQDDSGPRDDGVLSAAGTLEALVHAIAEAGGPADYAFREIPPEDNTSGGEPGGNIRVALLFNPDRVRFVDRPAPDVRAPVLVLADGGRPALSASPGLIQPAHPAFRSSRKPLACELEFAGRRVFVAVVHLASKSGDGQLFARSQPVLFRSESERLEQAALIRDFVSSILAVDPQAPVIVLGDFNEFGYAPPMASLKRAPLLDLAELLLRLEERYSYVYRGNAEDLDHILVSSWLSERTAPRLWIPHRYAEYLFGVRQTDHDPLLAAFSFPEAPR